MTLVLDADAVRAACGPLAAVDAITAALVAGLDPAADLPRQTVPLRGGEFLLMPSERSQAYAGIKVVTVAPDNPTRGLPRIQASYLLFDAESLSLRAVLDGTALTTLRTPAVSVAAVRSRLLAMPGPLRLAVFGAGPQAHGHAATLAATVPIASTTHLVRDDLGTPRAEDVLRAADVVVCATSARTPLFDANLIQDHAVVIAVGSHEPDAREVPAALCARATVVVEDVATALREAGDVCLAVRDGAMRTDDLVPMRDIVTGRVRPARDRPLLFKSVGMSWEDLVVAEAVIRAGR
ncbi:ornithine cyclodeaminase [Asanoa ishikariensis]|uniref:Ornithine cyclodeaminase n=1 Tax=Asanoa ishikariensis TaxID=137265 RepID=A0A1H3UAX9_9ACTN|nr:ornithine cyclodeaminase family protein [Asanoa ishikariensis]GIF63930.1 ornithine cyclodeaminase [Asanoa ishikariensis]SDZ59623.1 ornithine cyclodeaminase [Asanoa ishikariensis]